RRRGAERNGPGRDARQAQLGDEVQRRLPDVGLGQRVARRSRDARSSRSPNAGSAFISQFTSTQSSASSRVGSTAATVAQRLRANPAPQSICRELAEEFPRAEGVQAPAVGGDLDLAGQDDVEVATHLPLLDDRLAGRFAAEPPETSTPAARSGYPTH